MRGERHSKILGILSGLARFFLTARYILKGPLGVPLTQYASILRLNKHCGHTELHIWAHSMVLKCNGQKAVVETLAKLFQRILLWQPLGITSEFSELDLLVQCNTAKGSN